MVSAILKILHRETNGLHQAAFLLGVFAFASQILALLRDKLLAYTFGAGSQLDLYYAAFRIPDFLFVTVGSLVSLSVLIPFLMAEFEKGEEHTQKFVDSIFTLFTVSICFLGVLAFVFSSFLISHVFPGFTASQHASVLSIMRILLLSPILLGISNLFGSLTQSKNRFFVYSMSPLVYNIGIIVGIVLLYPRFGIVGLAYGVVLGAFLHLTIQLPTVLHLGLLPRITLKPNFAYVKKVILLSFPRTITLSASHIAIFFLLSLASLMNAGSISIFSLAFNLQSVPLSIFGVSYSMAAFPTLARLSAKGDKDTFLTHFISSGQQILFWVIPSSVLFIVLRAHIVRIVLGAGQFDWSATRLTAAVLALFCVSLVLQSLALLFVRGLYALGSTGKPFYITVTSSAIMVLLSYWFTNLFNSVPVFRYFMESLLKISDIPGTSVTMLALGFTVGSVIEGVWIWVLFRKVCKGFSVPLLASLFRISSASIVMGFITFLSLRFFSPIFGLDTFYGVFMQATISALCGTLIGVGTLMLLKSPELYDATHSLKQKFWKTKIVSPDSELV